MDSITLEKYRCFHDKQTARLAPLTLLVGENSTGKTSFLALIRALWDIEFEGIVPNFKKPPYDLGSFDEIAHFRGGRGGRAETFEAGFDYNVRNPKGGREAESVNARYEVTFGSRGTAPFPKNRSLEFEKEIRIEEKGREAEKIDEDEDKSLYFGTKNGLWKMPESPYGIKTGLYSQEIAPLSVAMGLIKSNLLRAKGFAQENLGDYKYEVVKGDSQPSDEYFEQFNKYADYSLGFPFWQTQRDLSSEPRILAYAPVRSQPLRTYDPYPVERDPAGRHIPHYLAEMQSDNNWESLKGALQDFGQASGLFDEISVRRLGKRNSDPFQIQIRKYGSKAKGPERNLIDVGYGVSQVLPLITEMSSRRLSDIRTTFLVQQPEIHLHPQAQAALGSLFCEAVSSGQRMVIETHSDYIIDRIRMEVRENNSNIKPEDVSILYFESGNLDVKIHSLELDESGNIFNVPSNYREFFRRETRRLLGM